MYNQDIRTERAFRHIKRGTDSIGLEIGPSHSPIASRKDGFQVHIMDRRTREELLDLYKSRPVDLDRIEEVDFVWRGESYAELTGKTNFYDWVIAAHLIEHTPDLIGFLLDCDSVMKEDGVLFLVIPDKRFCFDHYRPISGLAKVIDHHEHRYNKHSAGSVAEATLNAVKQAGKIAWEPGMSGEHSFVHDPSKAQDLMASVSQEGASLDVHAWCFVPSSLRLLIHDLHALGIIPFQEVDFAPTHGVEFYMTLGRKGEGPKLSRMDLLRKVQEECCNPEVGITGAGM